jgi:hypothetical protein
MQTADYAFSSRLQGFLARIAGTVLITMPPGVGNVKADRDPPDEYQHDGDQCQLDSLNVAARLKIESLEFSLTPSTARVHR